MTICSNPDKLALLKSFIQISCISRTGRKSLKEQNELNRRWGERVILFSLSTSVVYIKATILFQYSICLHGRIKKPNNFSFFLQCCLSRSTRPEHYLWMSVNPWELDQIYIRYKDLDLIYLWLCLLAKLYTDNVIKITNKQHCFMQRNNPINLHILPNLNQTVTFRLNTILSKTGEKQKLRNLKMPHIIPSN